MRAGAFVLVLCCAVSVAHADFELDDSAIELSAVYDHRPIRFPGERATVVGTGLHVSDRNGVLAKFLVLLFTTPSVERDSPYSVTAASTYRYLGNSTYERTTTYTSTVREGYATEAERDARHREKMAHRRAYLFFNGYTTDFQLWVPRDGQSTARGAAFAMTSAVARNARVAVELGLRWQYLRVDDGCGTAAAPVRCTSKFFGVPLTVVVSLGRLGRVEAGVGWNWRRSRLEDSLVQPYPLHLGLTLDLLDRVFVRGRVSSSIEDRGHAGLALEIGGRI